MNPQRVYQLHQREAPDDRTALVVLFNELLRVAAEGQAAIHDRNLPLAHERLVLAQQVLSSLRVSLPSEPEELVRNLQNLYLHCELLLGRANMAKDAKDVAEAIRVIAPLRDAWEAAAQAR